MSLPRLGFISGGSSPRIRSELRRVWLLLLAVVLFAMALNIRLSRHLQARVLEGSFQQQTYIVQAGTLAMDNFLAEVLNQFATIEAGEELIKLAQPHGLTLMAKDQAAHSLMRSLTLLKNRFPFVVQAYVYLYGSDYLITYQGYVAPSTFFYNRFSKAGEAWVQQLSGLRRFGFARAPLESSGAVPGASQLTIEKTLWRRGHPIGLVCLHLDEQTMLQYLTNARISQFTQVLLIQGGTVLLNHNQFPLHSLPMDNGLVKGIGLITRGASNVIADLDYYVITPEAVALRGIPLLFTKASFWLSIGIIVLGLLSAAMVFRAYRPLGKLSRLARSLGAVKTGRLSESALIQNTLETIWHNNAELKTALHANASLTQEGVLYRLLLGKQLPQDVLARTLSKETMDNAARGQCHYHVYVLQMAFSAYDSEQYFARQETAIIARLRQAGGDYLVALVKSGLNELTLVCHAPLQQVDAISDVLRQETAHLRSRHPGSCYAMSLGPPAAKLEAISNIYRLAKRQIHSRSINDDACLLLPGHPPGVSDIPQLSDEMENLLTNCTDEGKLKRSIEKMLQAQYERGLSVGAFIHLCAYLNGFLSRRLYSLTQHEDVLLEIDVLNGLYQADQLTEILFSNIELMVRRLPPPGLSGAQVPSAPALVEDIVNYVDKNCTNNINLKTVADAFGYNASYLSRYFKQNRGINFTDYLNSRRIELACQDLARPGATVKSAAGVGGFHSTSQFIATFEQYMGVTPGVYKKQLHKLATMEQ